MDKYAPHVCSGALYVREGALETGCYFVRVLLSDLESRLSNCEA